MSHTKRVVIASCIVIGAIALAAAGCFVPAWLRHANANLLLADEATDYEFDLLLGMDGVTSFSTLTDDQLTDLIPHFRNHINLQAIDLSGTAITDQGLAQLRDLPNLRTLNVTGTAVSQAAVDDAREALPDAEVVF